MTLRLQEIRPRAGEAPRNQSVNYYGTVGVLSNSSGTLDGTAVTADTLTPLAIGLLGDLGSTFSSGSLYVADQLMESVDQLSAPSATITSVTFGGSSTDPVITVQGTGFTAAPPPYAPCKGTGQDYKYGNLYLSDNTSVWGAGIPGDCVGLSVAKITATRAIYGLGSDYVTDGYHLNAGDAYTIGVDGATFSGTVSYAAPTSASITSVTPSTGGASTNVTIHGTNLTGTKYVFFGGTPAKNVQVVSATKITATVPPGTGTVSVTPVTSTGSAGTSSASYVYALPHISSLSPVKGSSGGGTTVTINGTNFGAATSLMFGSTAAQSVTVNSTTKITAITPPESPATVPVTVVTPAGTSNGVNYKFKT